MSAPKTAAGQDSRLLIARLGALLLGIPLARVSLPFLPKLFSDVSFGFMSRLGVFFGLIVLVWHWCLRREWFYWRSALFLLASVVSACAAYWSVAFAAERFFMLAITVTGAVLLALSQKFILDCSWNQAVGAMILAPAFFHLVSYGARLFPGGRDVITEYLPNYWQVGYLLGMFVVPDLVAKEEPSLAAAH